MTTLWSRMSMCIHKRRHVECLRYCINLLSEMWHLNGLLAYVTIETFAMIKFAYPYYNDNLKLYHIAIVIPYLGYGPVLITLNDLAWPRLSALSLTFGISLYLIPGTTYRIPRGSHEPSLCISGVMFLHDYGWSNINVGRPHNYHCRNKGIWEHGTVKSCAKAHLAIKDTW